MRLLYTKNPGDMPEVREFLGTDIPPYATILSHTWGDDEVTLQQLLAGAADPTSLQTQSGLPQDPADTSSAELTEAINSMFAWYRDAAVCYAYLADLESGSFDDLEETLPGCRWSTRGWTLQELMAPEKVLFFDRQWDFGGSKADLAVLISKVTGIPMSLLCHEAELCDFAVARRMSWAAERVTTPASAL